MNDIVSLCVKCLYINFIHNDLPWQYRQYAQNKVYEVNLRADTRIQWSNTTNMTSNEFPRIPPQTDITRFKQGMVGAEVTVFNCK